MVFLIILTVLIIATVIFVIEMDFRYKELKDELDALKDELDIDEY